MPFNPDIHHRHSIRLKNYDYSQCGAYFVTICAWQRECLFGEILTGEMVLNEMARVVESVWRSLPEHFTGINLDGYVIMPNHFHGILQIYDSVKSVGAKQDSSALPASDDGAGNGAIASKQDSSALPGFGDDSKIGGIAYKGEADNPCFAPTRTFEPCCAINKGKAGETLALPLQSLHGTVSGSLCSIVQNFKSVSTRKINKYRNNPACPIWQKNYYERIIRNEDELFRTREYIVNNPMKWMLDKENPVYCR